MDAVRRFGLVTRPIWPGTSLAVLDPAVAVGLVARLGAAVAVALAAAAGVVRAAAVVLGAKKGQLFLDPAPLAGSGLWRGQRCPWFQLLGPTRLPESVVVMVIASGEWPRSSRGSSALRTTRSEDA